MAVKRISKSILSMFLRTKCDRELFLSLHEESELEANNMPVPLQARPGIGVLQGAGQDFELERNSELINIFGSAVLYQPDKASSSKPVKVSLGKLLSRATTTPSFLLQGKFDPTAFQANVLTNIGLSAAQASIIPPIAGLIPDIIVVRKPNPGDEEINVNGSRKAIDIATENRLALSIIDIKHTSEANPSYCSEVALYALFLANWLRDQGLSQRYFVTNKSYLWTRYKQGHSKLAELVKVATAPTADQCLDALIADCEDARVRTYKIAFPGKRPVIQGSRREPMDDRSPFLADRRSVRTA